MAGMDFDNYINNMNSVLIDQIMYLLQVDILLPEVEDIPADILTELSGQLHHLVNDLPVSRLVEHEFLEAFVKRGTYM